MQSNVDADTLMVERSLEHEGMCEDNIKLVERVRELESGLKKADAEIFLLTGKVISSKKSYTDRLEEYKHLHETNKALQANKDEIEWRLELLKGYHHALQQTHEEAMTKHEEAVSSAETEISDRLTQLRKLFEEDTSEQFKFSWRRRMPMWPRESKHFQTLE